MNAVSTEQRQRAILTAAQLTGGVHVSQLRREHQVSDITIRRDLAALQHRGLITRVHGGAVPTNRRDHPAVGGDRGAAWRAIATRAAALARPGSTVAVTAGPLAIPLALALAGVPTLTIVTNSLAAATTLCRHGRSDQSIVILGGTQTRSGSYIGPLTITAAESITADLIYLGVSGMTTETGFTVDNLIEADTDRAIIRRARRVVVLADHTMWNRIGLATVTRLSDAHTLVTDTPPEAHTAAAQQIPEILVAPPAMIHDDPPDGY